MSLDLNNPAWDFALEFYGQPGMSDACLTLQDQIDADIVGLVMVLFCWARRRQSLSQQEIATLASAMQDWRAATVLPLRRIRRDLKSARADLPQDTKEILRSTVKKAELLAEQIHIAMIFALLPPMNRTVPVDDLGVVIRRFLSQEWAGDVPKSCQIAIGSIVRTVALSD